MYLSRDEEPDAGRLQALLKRAELDRSAVAESVRSILGRVKEEGDNALFALEAQFDHAELSSLNVSSEELDAAEKLVGGDLKKALRQASHNIRAFHEAQVPKGESLEVEPGVRLSRRIVPIHTVGLYIPGGTAPLFSTVTEAVEYFCSPFSWPALQAPPMTMPLIIISRPNFTSHPPTTVVFTPPWASWDWRSI